MVDKKLWYLAREQFRHAQRQRKAGVVFVRFNRIDGLPRDAKPARKFTLAPTGLFAIVF